MNSKMVRILTTRVSCGVHEQYHLIHFRHLQIYCSSPTTSAKKLDVGLQAAVPSYDARYFVYERVAKQGIIHWHEIRLRAKSPTIYFSCTLLFCDYVGTNPIYRRYMEISFNYLVYSGGHI